MPHALVQFTAALYVLGLARVPELIECADALLTDGIYTYSLGELFTYRIESRANPDWLFENAVGELGLAMPSREQAAFQVARHHLTAIVEGRSNPRTGLSTLQSAFGFGYYHSGDDLITAAGCWELFKRFYVDYIIDYDEHTPGTEELEQGIVNAVRKWIHDHCGVPFEANWRSTTVAQLAEAISAVSAFERLPILADALEEAGCINQQILEHCRFPRDHIRGCWVVDLILGKS